ncbi:NADP-dependent oxidoreductase [Streptomyces sp. NBC_00102]|uniref:quinone oxidoreductase family protein n=1 Tax=Streptomyces sp. NBC_00102 TaxID=2975652 RepID=UPI00225090FA|nr:NADP-dependent oxidoreductase [Streptomyces sp. NBC_00102]MCX5396067.1 NADP-dependent oxidoreductase [Streptomyces sp. NBC_00102]
MNGVGAKRFGGPEVLEVLELAEPEAGPGQIRIRVRAAAVNPTDTLLISGAGRRKADPPHVPGMDAAGVVEQIGEGVTTGLRVGDHVMAVVVPVGAHGAYAERIVVPAESVVRVPSGASDVEASTLPMNALTAWAALESLGIPEGGTVVVTGAAGALGGYTIELAKAAGLRVVADAAPKDEELVRGLGADLVLPRGEDFPEEVRRHVPGGADGLVDGALFDRAALPAVRDGGRIATLRRYEGEPERGITFHPVLVSDHALDHGALVFLRRLAEEKRLTPRVAYTLPAERAAEAHRAMAAGGVRGRIVLEF